MCFYESHYSKKAKKYLKVYSCKGYIHVSGFVMKLQYTVLADGLIQVRSESTPCVCHLLVYVSLLMQIP